MRPSITKLLVASRGEMARRVVRTAREMGIATVAVFTEADRGALHVADADEAVALDRLSGRGPGAYLDGPALVEAARRAGADAVHPGAGPLAEDAGFAWRCAEAGLLYAGPSPEAIATLGSKLEAKALAAGAGVPVLEAEEVEGYPPGKLEAAAEVLGWPVVVKASAGAGGRGLRVVREGEDLVGAVEATRREATACFGDGTLFLEPWLEPIRRVDVQIFGDAAGRLVHLFERDGSLSRHHRTVIEEAPAPKLPQPLRERLVEAALAVAEAVGYAGAGTVEFLVAGEQLWFGEINTRLDLGHPVTEAILGLDLVRMQLAAAEGRPLPVEARHCSPSGHAVGARLCATGADDDGTATGRAAEPRRLRRFEIDPAPGLRVETGVATGSLVTPDDGLRLATVVAHAPTRTEAIHRLAAALEGMRIHGLRTNRDDLIAVLRHPAFLAGEVDTGFLDREDAALEHPLARPRGGPEAVRLHALAAALAGLPRDGDIASGSTIFAGPAGERVEVRYRLDATGAVADADVHAEIDGVPLPGLRIGAVTPEAVDIEVDGLRRRVAVARSGDIVDCDSRLGHTELVVLKVCYEA
ncbi:MAG: biotin carboxylase N-terminal domain-containing protein [Actinomycetota bacterium]|jgi:propionyl-CoA carboxylase alpha chain